MDINQLKKLAAEKAVEEISSGMVIGLGSGSTVQFALEKISERIKNGELKNIVGIPSSSKTEKEAIRLGIPLTTLNELITLPTGRQVENGEWRIKSKRSSSILNLACRQAGSQFSIGLTIDGADEFDDELNLIKGGGGALLREKILAQASKRLIIITDESKHSKHLGTKWPVPIEVLKFSVGTEKKFLESLNAKVELRKNSDGSNYITDENNFILDANFGKIRKVKELSDILNDRAGIVGHGLFIGLADQIICAKESGIEIFTGNS
ncbi:MAG: ribose 5-phosphate isomerase A [Ignavibacteriales bacterium]|nr:ribose 5-phosphate isomerase A [Ignavibacteriales bacterium]